MYYRCLVTTRFYFVSLRVWNNMKLMSNKIVVMSDGGMKEKPRGKKKWYSYRITPLRIFDGVFSQLNVEIIFFFHRLFFFAAGKWILTTRQINNTRRIIRVVFTIQMNDYVTCVNFNGIIIWVNIWIYFYMKFLCVETCTVLNLF